MLSRGKLRVVGNNREDGGDSIVGGICFDDDLLVGDPVRKHRGGSESLFQSIESGTAGVGEIPDSGFPRESGERNHDGGVVVDETTIEVCEAEEGLDVFDFPRFGPLLYDFDLVFGHLKSARREDISEILDGVSVEGTFLRRGVKPMFPETSEDLVDLLLVQGQIVGVYQDIV